MGSARWVVLVLVATAVALLSLHPASREAAGRALAVVRWRIFGADANEHYRLAERYYEAGDYEKSDAHCREALRLHPGHAPAAALQMEVTFLLGKGRAAFVDDWSAHVMNFQQMFVEMDNCLAAADRFCGAGDDTGAEREYRKLLEYAKWIPTGVEVESRRKRALEGLDRLATGRSAGEGSAPRAGPSAPSSP